MSYLYRCSCKKTYTCHSLDVNPTQHKTVTTTLEYIHDANNTKDVGVGMVGGGPRNNMQNAVVRGGGPSETYAGGVLKR